MMKNVEKNCKSESLPIEELIKVQQLSRSEKNLVEDYMFVSNIILPLFPESNSRDFNVKTNLDEDGDAFQVYKIVLSNLELILEKSKSRWKVGIISRPEIIIDFKGAFNRNIRAKFVSPENKAFAYRPYNRDKKVFSFECENQYTLYKALDLIGFFFKNLDIINNTYNQLKNDSDYKVKTIKKELGSKNFLYFRRMLRGEIDFPALAWMDIMINGETKDYSNEVRQQTHFVVYDLTEALNLTSDFEELYRKITVIDSTLLNSYRYPVFKMDFREELGLELILTKKDDVWLLSVNSEKELEFNLKAFGDEAEQLCIDLLFSGFPGNRRYDYYRNDKKRFTIEVKDDYKLYSLLSLISNNLVL